MAHSISGIITSFRYEGELPSCHLVDDFVFIPLTAPGPWSEEDVIRPFVELTPSFQQLAEELSLRGACAFVETDYHGGIGCQAAMVWKDGKVVLGPLTDAGTTPEAGGLIPQPSDEPINEALRYMGLQRRGDSDEFDTARLGRGRSNEHFSAAVA